MNRSILKNLLKSIIVLTIIVSSVFGQYTKGNTVIAWSKYKFKPVSEVEDGSGKDRRESIEAYHKGKNAIAKQLLSSLFLTHYWTGAVTDVHFINEFNNMEDATVYSGDATALNKKAWQKEEDRKAALTANSKYFQSYHEDLHLFENHVKLEKKRKSKDSPNTVVAVTTSYWKPLKKVEGGSSEEREKMMQEYFKKVTMKNDKILSQRVVTHLWTGSLSNGYYPITRITEFASMADADDLETGPKIFDKVFITDDEKKAYRKYWAPASHEDIGLFWNQAYANKLK
jgi:hypothetical protein